MTTTQLDWNATEEKARGMTVAELLYSIRDCSEAAEAAWALEKAGNPVSKTQGYYHDELSVYARELERRRA
jgi:hypothetical protein